jgi:K+-transporting ATPase ATPase C chain
MKVIKSLRAPVLVTLVLLLICGLIYPVVMTLMSQALFPSQANGSIIYVDGQAVGAKNVGQDFTDPRFMRCRPSAYQYNTYTVDEEGNKFYNDGSAYNYNTYYEEDTDGDGQVEQYYNDGSEFAGLSSGSNNYGASNPALAERVQGDIDEFLAEHPDLTVEDIPTDLVTASGSGLDPHISPASAAVQIPQLAENTGLTEEQLEQFVADNTTGKVLGIFGEETVNVLGVNLDIAEALGLIGGVD